MHNVACATAQAREALSPPSHHLQALHPVQFRRLLPKLDARGDPSVRSVESPYARSLFCQIARITERLSQTIHRHTMATVETATGHDDSGSGPQSGRRLSARATLEGSAPMRDSSSARRGIAHTFFQFLGILAAASLFAWTSEGAANVKARAALRSDAEVERSVIPRGETLPVYVLVRFEASDLDEPHATRPPLNLSLVLDRSGSMADKGKIEYLREAAKMAVGSLGERDVLSVVEFDDRITLIWPASHVHDIGRLQSEIDELSPRGSTNLAGGMQRGIDEALGAREGLRLSPETLSRVILLTDGLANTGLTDHGAIAELASRARDQGVRVSTIGLGLDYDEDLLQAVAEGGGGKYYYVESPVQLARIFQNELNAAFA